MFSKLREEFQEILDFWNCDIRDEDIMEFYESSLKNAIDNNSSFKLYRYMPATYFNIRNIETQKIHLSNNGVMNDVYDCIPGGNEELSYETLNQLDDIAYMTCLSEEQDNVLMWSHYAQCHEGICVEYDLKRLKLENLKILKHIYPVLYSDKRLIKRDIKSLIRSYKNLERNIEDNNYYDGDESLDDILPMCLIKGKMWSYENEWRIIYTKKQMYDIDDDVLYGCNIPFECVSAVYLGHRIHPEIRANILEIAKRFKEKGDKINIYQVKLKTQGYEIESEEIDLSV